MIVNEKSINITYAFERLSGMSELNLDKKLSRESNLLMLKYADLLEEKLDKKCIIDEHGDIYFCLGIAYLSIGMRNEYLKKIDVAKQFYLLAVDNLYQALIRKEIYAAEPLYTTYYKIGEIEINKRNERGAKEYFTKCIVHGLGSAILIEIAKGPIYEITKAYYWAGLASEQIKEREKACYYFNQAIETIGEEETNIINIEFKRDLYSNACRLEKDKQTKLQLAAQAVELSRVYYSHNGYENTDRDILIKNLGLWEIIRNKDKSKEFILKGIEIVREMLTLYFEKYCKNPTNIDYDMLIFWLDKLARYYKDIGDLYKALDSHLLSIDILIFKKLKTLV